MSFLTFFPTWATALCAWEGDTLDNTSENLGMLRTSLLYASSLASSSNKFDNTFQGPGASQLEHGMLRTLQISLGHSVPANTEQIHIFPGFSQLLVQCTKMSLPWGGGYVYAFRNL